MAETIERWSADKAGCIYEGSSLRTGDELHAVTILLAVELGMASNDSSHAAMILLNESGTRWANEDTSELLYDGAEEAVGWLNEYVAPKGYWFEFSDGLILTNEEN